MPAPVRIIKVGGSLYDLPDLADRLTSWLNRQRGDRLVVVPGGGAAADVVRSLDAAHGLGEEAAHWLALRMLQVNAHFLASLLSAARIIASPLVSCPVGILDALAFALEDEARPGRLPHDWNATSDSIAVRAAIVAEAREVVLLKSVDWQGDDWPAAARSGIVDAYFPHIVAQAPELSVRVVNFRSP